MKDIKKLFSNSFIVFVGTFVGSVFSYLFNIKFMANMLGPELYGEFSALLSLFIIVSAAGAAILTIAMSYSGEMYAKKKYKLIEKFYQLFTKYIAIAGVAFLIVGVISLGFIKEFLGVSHGLAIIFTYLGVVISLLIMINKGILQGCQRFKSISIISVLEMALRLVIGVSLVYFGYALNGAILAVAIAVFLTYFWSYKYLRNIFQKKGNIAGKFSFNKKELLGYSWPTLITTIFLAVFLSVDILIIKHYFSSYDAGVYAAISTIAKIVFYLTGPIVGVMFPMISEKKAQNQKHYQVFLLSVLFTLFAGILVLAIYAVIPGTIIRILSSPEYIGFYPLLIEVGLVMFLYAVINLIANYYMALKDFKFLWFMGLTMVGMLGGIFFYHPSVLIVVRIMIFSFAFLLLCMIIYYVYTKKDQVKLLISGEHTDA